MAYVDHAFSISDDDILMGADSAFMVNNRRLPIKEISLAFALLVFGILAIIFGVYMASNKIGGDTAHGLFFAMLGGILFIPGFYYTRIAYYAYKGYQGFSFADIPAV
ncbi:hypothetical protein Leryth_018821 [Lithospermum erythrorhizon]|uniref:Transmembrane protein 230 n=1 Tax=Lithospermum erythrorhizon TaxID=34254 RepID=A0AAV3NYT8_LITER|nr:hypothetical protein Leryth_018821 [Lithospermum erythrorhizon]